MAPEVFDGHGYGASADVWAAGCVCYEVLCRRKLFGGMNCLALIRALESFKNVDFSSTNLE